MQVLDLLKQLQKAGIRLTADNGKLQVKAPKGALTAELGGQIKRYKADILAFLAQQSSVVKDEQVAPILPRPTSLNTLPLSYAQQRLWLIDKLQGGSAEYNMPVVLNITGKVNAPLLEQVFQRLIERHEILRTVYHEIDGEPMQHIRAKDECCFVLKVCDLQSQAPTAQTEQLTSLKRQEMGSAFDLSKDLMLRATLYILSAGEAQLVVNVHHIASDGWSMDVLNKEFYALYTCAGESDPLPPLAIQYGDYAYWQQNKDDGDKLVQQQDYWAKQLADAPAVHSLPLARPRPDVKQHQGASISGQLPAQITESLMELAKRYQLTPFMLLHGALSLLLSRHSYSHDIVVGIPVANRLRTELAPLIGFFVNTLVLRADTRHEDLANYFSHIQQVHLQAQSHQDITFDQIVDRLNIPRSAAHSPLFQIMMRVNSDYGVSPNNTANAPERPLDGVKFSPDNSDYLSAKFDLDVDFHLSDEGLNINWIYDVQLFDANAITTLNNHLCTMLTGLSKVDWQQTAPQCLPMLSAAETHQQLQNLNDVALDYDDSQCIHQLFEQQASVNPNNIALVCGNRQLTYREVNLKANQVANYLLAKYPYQKGQDRLIGICLSRSAQMVIGLLGILKAGAAYVPLDPAYPKDRLHYVIDDAALQMVISSTEDAKVLSSFTGELLCLDNSQDLEQCSVATPNLTESGLNSHSLAYVIYTSGSTGRPKGVLQTHTNVVRLFSATESDFNFNAGDCWCLFHSVSFDFSVWELWGPLFYGGKLLVLHQEEVVDTKQFVDVIQRHGLTVLNQTPGAFRNLVDYLRAESCTLPHLRTVIFGGEALTSQHVRDWFASPALSNHVQLINMYGITETTVHVTYHEVNGPTPGQVGIGRPLKDQSIVLLDPYLNLTPQGTPGEAYVGGNGLARGYLNRPELTAERFIANPFYDESNPNSSPRLYRTGDVLRFLPNGNLEFVGRADDQVKIRGFRIELGEVESQISQLEQVDAALVLAKEIAGSQQLLAYIKPASALDTGQHRLFINEIKQAISKTLPDYMVPGIVMVVNTWPLTANGKVDRKALPKPDATLLQDNYVNPTTELERQIAVIWADLLEIAPNKLSTNAAFFQLGGHSLLAIKLLNQMKLQLNADISLADFFKEPTISGLASKLESAAQHGDNPVIRQDGSVPHPLSFGQKRLWMVQQMDVDSIQYSMPAVFQLPATLNVQALSDALRLVVYRHHILRTRYFEKSGDTWQQVQKMPEQVLEYVDISDSPENQRREQRQKLINQNASKPFDLGSDLMLRATLVGCVGEDYQLLFNMHHIASDGGSLTVLMQELQQAYIELEQGKEPTLPELSNQYIDFVHWQRDRLSEDRKAQELTYWQQQLANVAPMHSLPLLKAQHAQAQVQGKLLRQTLNTPVIADLEPWCQSASVTPFVFVYSAFCLLLSRFSESSDIVLGTPISERRHQAFEPLLGLFVNNLTLRTQVPDEGSVLEYVQQNQRTVLTAFEHSQAPFEQLVDALNIPRVTGCHPLFQILFSWENQMQKVSNAKSDTNSNPAAMDLSLEPELVPLKLDLEVTFTRHKNGINVTWNYNSQLFPEWLIQHMADGFEVLLTDMLQDQHKSLNDLVYLKENLYHQLTAAAKAPVNAYWQSQRIEQRFTEQAKRTLNNIAIRCKDTHYNYAQVDNLSDRLASQLLQHISTPTPVIAICLDRHQPWPLAMLAVLKMGGTYVPIDPKYPEDRIQYIIEDSHAKVLISQQQILRDLSDVLPDELSTLSLDNVLDISASRAAELQQKPLADVQYSQNPMAYMIYTSGTTGQPKGTMVNHGGLCNLAEHAKKRYGINNQSRYLQALSFSFDAAGLDWMGTLLNGGELIIADGHSCVDPEALGGLIEKHQATHFCHVPTFATKIPVKYLYQLQVLLLGGEPIEPAIATALASRCTLFNIYGPTENSIASTDKLVAPQDSVITIGAPIKNTWCLVLDDAMNPVPPGVTGGLYLGGVGVAKGYLGKEEQSRKAFIQNPFYQDSYSKIYKTGDRVRWLDNGELEFVGRTDSQIKIRGYRVELAEIQEQLERLEQVVSATVLVVGKDHSQNIVAFVVPADSSESEGRINKTILSKLRKVLPAHMVPAWCQTITELPTTTNGKVDTKTLHSKVRSVELHKDYVAPGNPLERQLQDIWGATLGLEKPCVESHFFDLGGHSFLAIQLVLNIRSQLQVNLSVTDIFQHPSIASLANHLTHQSDKDSFTGLITLSESDTSQFNLICIPGVLGLSSQFEPLAKLLHQKTNVMSFDYPGLFDRQQVQGSIDEICDDFINTLSHIDQSLPLVLLGHSFGGVIALEMAKRLEQRGENVMVVLLDSHFNTERNGQLARFDFDNDAAFKELTQALIASSAHTTDKQQLLQLSDNINHLYRTQKQLSDNYKLTETALKALYIFAEDSKPVLSASGQINQMKSLLTNTLITSMPGNHLTMLNKSGSQAIVKHLNDFLNNKDLPAVSLSKAAKGKVVIPN